jgi:hypothetical protein
MRPGLRSLGERCVRYMQLRGGLLIQSARGKPGRPVDVLDDSGFVLASCGLSCKVGLSHNRTRSPAVSASAMGHDPPSRSFRRPEQTGSVIVELPEGRAEVL